MQVEDQQARLVDIHVECAKLAQMQQNLEANVENERTRA